MKQTQTDWDELYRRRETPWEKGKPHPALIDFLEERWAAPRKNFCSGLRLRPRCARAQHRGEYVLGIDVATRAMAKAEARPRVGNEEYLLADLFDLPAKFDHQFDWVFEHTCFCAIDPGSQRLC